MRERAASAGGELTAGPLPGGGFRVTATLPAAVPGSAAAPGSAAVPGSAALPGSAAVPGSAAAPAARGDAS